MSKQVLFFIKEPSLKLYFVSGNHFSTEKADAKVYDNRDEALNDQKVWLEKGIDLQFDNAIADVIDTTKE